MYTAQLLKEAINARAKYTKTTVKKMLSDIGLGSNFVTQASDKGGVSCFGLAKIADYLGCSVDYLLGRTENPESHKVPNTEGQSLRDVLDATFDQLSEESQYIVIGEAKKLLREESVAADQEALGKSIPSSGTEGSEKKNTEEKPA